MNHQSIFYWRESRFAPLPRAKGYPRSYQTILLILYLILLHLHKKTLQLFPLEDLLKK